MQIVFKNKGLINKTAITTFGVSSKESNNPIGYFGTGLKYAIAILLRNNCKITIYRGYEKFEFALKKEKIRVNEFDIVIMNKRKLSFTTELGKTWTVEQAFRELYCNTMDEQGTIEATTWGHGAQESGYTTIVCSGYPIEDAFTKRSEIILLSKPIYATDSLEVHDKPSNYLYYRGIQAARLDRPSRYTYNIMRKQELTEDRTFKVAWLAVANMISDIVNINDKEIIKGILTVPSGNYEYYLNFSYESASVCEVFLITLNELIKTHLNSLNLTTLELAKKMNIHKDMYLDSTLNTIEQQVLTKAISFCKRIDVPVDYYPIRVVDTLGEGILGQAKDDTIFIAKRTFDLGSKMVVATLIEEYFHLLTGYYDCTRSFQDHIFNKLVSLGELYLNESL